VSVFKDYQQIKSIMSNKSDLKELTGKTSEVWKHVLVKSGDDPIVKCKYRSAKFNQSKSLRL